MTDCTICNGWGKVRLDLPSHHPDFGKLVPCVCKQPAPPEDPNVEQWRNRADVDEKPVQEPIPF